MEELWLRVCATARLFLDWMLPEDLDSGILLDTDTLLLDDIRQLWQHFRYFSPAQLMGMAAVENTYGRLDHVPSYGPPGVGLNPGVIMMNLTRLRLMSGAGLTGAIKWVVGRSGRKYLQIAYKYFKIFRSKFPNITKAALADLQLELKQEQDLLWSLHPPM